MIDNTIKKVTVKNNNTTKVHFKNNEPVGEITIKKEDENLGNEKRFDGTYEHGDATIKNSVYKLYANEDIYNVSKSLKYFSKDEEIATFTYNESGQATIKITNMNTRVNLRVNDTTLNGLPVGSYYSIEETAGEGYTLDTEKQVYDIKYKDKDTATIKVDAIEKNRVQRAKFEVIKISSNKNEVADVVEGAEFTAILTKYVDYYGSFEEALKHLDQYAEDEYSIFKTQANGHGTSGLLAYGEYTVNETYTPSSKINTVEEFHVDINKDSDGIIREIVANDTPFEAYIKIQKKDKGTGKVITYSNATFSLYKLSEKTYKYEKVKCKVGNKYHEKWTTDKDGIAITETKLKSGKYKIEELSSPYSFVKLNKEVIFELNNDIEKIEYDEDWDAYVTVDVYNEQVKGKINLNKKINFRKDIDKSLIKDIDFKKISFELLTKEDIINFIDGSIIYEKGTSLGVYNLDENGNLVIDNLDLGHYVLKEKSTIDGLILDENEHDVVLEQKDNTLKEISYDLNIENMTTVVEFSKKSITGGEELQGATMQVVDENKTIIDDWISGKPHKIEGLEVGKTYTLIEKSAPYAFEVAENITFTVLPDNNGFQKIEMKDKPILTDIRLVKIDRDTKEIIKDKFEFGLYADEECKQLIQQVSSNKKDGTVIFKDLPYGEFFVKELSSPKNYQLSDKIVKIIINEKGVTADNQKLIEDNNGIYSFIFDNKAIPKIHTGTNINYILLISLLVISVIGIAVGLFFLKKINKIS